jgi:hypothetical protein
VNTETIHHLLTINREFYQKFGAAFAQTRQRVQPGVARVVEEYVHDGHWLDLGCGSGALLKCCSNLQTSPALISCLDELREKKKMSESIATLADAVPFKGILKSLNI